MCILQSTAAYSSRDETVIGMLPSPQHRTFKTVISSDLKTTTLSPCVIALMKTKSAIPNLLSDTANTFYAVYRRHLFFHLWLRS